MGKTATEWREKLMHEPRDYWDLYIDDILDDLEVREQAGTLSLEDTQRYARLSRLVADLLTKVDRGGSLETIAVAKLLVRLDTAWQDVPHRCRCEPPGSGGPCCTGHCRAAAADTR